MIFNKLKDLESLSFIDVIKTKSIGLGVKKAIYSIRDTLFCIEVDYWRGDDFYSYDVKKIIVAKSSISVKVNELVEDGEWNMEDVLPMLPKDIQLEVIMNLDLFCKL